MVFVVRIRNIIPMQKRKLYKWTSMEEVGFVNYFAIVIGMNYSMWQCVP